MLRAAVFLWLLHFGAAEIAPQISAHYSGVPKIVCDSLLYRTVYHDSTCYFVIDAEDDLPRTVQKCARVLSRAKLAEDAPDTVWDSVFAKKSDFLRNSESEGQKKAMCIYESPFPALSESETNAKESRTAIEEAVPVSAKLNLPLIVPFKGTPVPGQVIVIKGIMFDLFVINIESYNGTQVPPAGSFNAIPLHFIFRFNIGQAVFNTATNYAQWGREQSHPIPLRKGDPFDIRIRFHSDHFETFVNLKKFQDYKYRTPIDWCKSMWIDGGAHINYVDVGEKRNPLPYSTDLSKSSEGKSVGVNDKMLTSQTPLPITKQFNEMIEPGHNLTIRGGVAANVDQFVVNLQNGGGNVIALHFNFRFNKGQVIHNSCGQYGQWGGEQISGLPIGKGASYEFLIRFHIDRFQIFVNQREFSTYYYRLPLTAITHIHVGGLGYLTLVELVGEKYRPAPIVSEISALPVCGERYCVSTALQTTTAAEDFKSFVRRQQAKGCKKLIVTGVISSFPGRNSDNAIINLFRKNGDVALQIKPKFDRKVVLLNSRKAGKWMEEIVVDKFPFVKDESFDLTITNEAAAFQIFVNNNHLVTFPHRLCTYDISTVDVAGIHALDIRI